MTRSRLELLALLVAALLLFTANAERLSLPSLDDCFYARKGVEMERAERVLTVTWNGQPTFQNPPLQIWILARSFALLGENDFAARLPSILMAFGLLGGVWWIARGLWGEAQGTTAVALLLASPLFLNQARRCMLEVPLALWTVAGLLLFSEGRARPRLLALLAVPLGAALLTKSVLGLVPVLVAAAAAALDAGSRRQWRAPWLWAGIAGGLALGAAWPLHQALAFGRDALRAHLAEIGARSVSGGEPLGALAAYPRVLLGSYQPVVLPALAGVVALVRARREAPQGLLVVAWLAAPILLYGLLGAQAPRYLFPTLPAMALAAGFWLQRVSPLAALLARRAVPPLLLAGAALFWTRPQTFTRSGNDAFKYRAAPIRALVPADEPLTYYGTNYWGLANPLLYYVERALETPADSARDAAAAALSRRSRLLMVDTNRVEEVEAAHPRCERVLAGDNWVLLRVRRLRIDRVGKRVL